MRWIVTFLVFPIFCFQMALGQSEPKIALIIANSNYDTPGWDLENPTNDADAMEGALEEIGFEVYVIKDAARDQMEQAFKDHGDRLRNAGEGATGFFFFAGHGVQSEGLNYLIPTDSRPSSEADVWAQAPRLDNLFRHLKRADNLRNFVVLDACRDNPLLPSIRSAGRGLATATEVSGTLIAYATAPGATAEDGNGNSPYTRALADLIVEPGISVESMFRRVRTRVSAETNNSQRPWIESGLSGYEDYCFAGCDGDRDIDPMDLQAWIDAYRLDTADAYASYLTRSPNGLWADEARELVRSLSYVETPSMLVPTFASDESWKLLEFDTTLIEEDCQKRETKKADACAFLTDIDWSPDGSSFAMLKTGQILEIWSRASSGVSFTLFQTQRTPDNAARGAREVKWHPSGERIALAGADGIVYLYARGLDDQFQVFDTWGSNGLWIESVEWSKSGRNLVVSDSSGAISMLSIQPDGKFSPAPQIVQSEKRPGVVSISHDGQYLAIEGYDDWKSVSLFRLSNDRIVNELPRILNNHSDWVTATGWSPLKNQLAIGSMDNTISISKIENSSGNPNLEERLSLEATVTSLAWHPDGSRIVATDEEYVYLWGRVSNSPSWERKILLDLDEVELGGLGDFEWSPQGDLLTAAGERQVFRWMLN
ncbi:MAG: caspase family protein [Pseudomonadota bacterium]